jgi:hypothetical protein
MVGMTYSPQNTGNEFDPFTGSILPLEGPGYYPKLVLTSLRKDFIVRKVEVFVKYANDPQTYTGSTFYAPEYHLSFEQRDGTTKQMTLRIPPSEYVAYLTVIECGKGTSVFIPFIVDKGPPSFFERVEFRFTDYRGRRQSVIVNKDDIDIRNTMWEPQYWTESSPGK